MGLLFGCGCGLLVLLVILVIYSVIIRAAVWISNKCLGNPDDRRYRDDYDDWDDYERPRRRRAAIPEPDLGKGMGIAFVVVIISFVMSLGTQFAIGAAGGGGGNNPFRGGGNDDPALALVGSCFQLIAGFFVWTGALSLMLPTPFPRAALVSLFVHLIGFVIGVIIIIIVIVAVFAVGAGGGFR